MVKSNEKTLYENNINDMPENMQLAIVSKYGYEIQYIRNPSEEMKLAAVRQDGNLIKYIKYPSDAVQLAAIKNNISALRYILPSKPIKKLLPEIPISCYSI